MNELQKTILDIFKEIKSICDKNEIKYFAIGGTCIGAVRHKGFIPWDDDLDIAIPIEDYDKFFEIAQKELRSNYEIYKCENVRHYHYIFRKIIDNKTTFIENSEIQYKDAYKGVYVDVMPISGIPCSLSERNKFCKKVQLYSKLNVKRRFNRFGKTAKGKIAWIFLKLMNPYIGINYFSDKLYSLLKRYPLADSELTGYVWSENLNKLIFPTKYFAETVELPFEDTDIKCPKMYHEYLTDQFGDYMVIPDVDRQQHHAGIVDLETPFRIYKEKQILQK